MEPSVPFSQWSKLMVPQGHNFLKLFCVTQAGLKCVPITLCGARSEAEGETLSSRPCVRLIGGSSGWIVTVKGVQEVSTQMGKCSD